MDENNITPEDINNEANRHLNNKKPFKHNEIPQLILNWLQRLNFRVVTGILDEEQELKINHYLIACVEEIFRIATLNNFSIGKNNDFIYLFNGVHWKEVEKEPFQKFLGEAAEKMGIDIYNAKYYIFREQLYKQFMALAYLPKPDPPENCVYVCFSNGVYVISAEKQELIPHRAEFFITHVLTFPLDQKAEAPQFKQFLNRVQPDTQRQMILAEYIAYLFITPNTLKLEKTLLLYGNGANGKSVFFEVVTALLGKENVSNYSLQNLTDNTGYYRAMISDKLLNYASEINGKMDISNFKRLVSGEPIDARLPYGKPFVMSKYAKLIFNCNELPKEVEQTNAFFRRLLIIPFDVTIPENEQDKQLATKIIETELSGVFNWVLDGLMRLLAQRHFTESDAVSQQLETYKSQTDSVKLFLEENQYKPSVTDSTALKDIFLEYRSFCNENLYHACSNKTFSERLRKMNFVLERRNAGMVVFIQK